MGNPLDLKTFIRDVADFPKAGITFKDITPLLRSRDAFRQAVRQMTDPFRKSKISQIVAIESRGFIFGSAMATELRAGFVPIRKPGKLPWTTFRNEYTLEYGSGTLEIHRDALASDDRVLIVDDVLATGGTAAATCALVAKFDATIVSLVMLMELGFLSGREKLPGLPVYSLIQY